MEEIPLVRRGTTIYTDAMLRALGTFMLDHPELLVAEVPEPFAATETGYKLTTAQIRDLLSGTSRMRKVLGEDDWLSIREALKREAASRSKSDERPPTDLSMFRPLAQALAIQRQSKPASEPRTEDDRW